MSRLRALKTTLCTRCGSMWTWTGARMGDIRATVPGYILATVAIGIVLLIGIQVWLSITLSNRALTLSESTAHRTIASTFADKLRALGTPTLGKVLFQHVRDLAAFNPAVRIYIVDDHGIVRASPDEYGKVVLPFVDTRPLKRALNREDKTDLIFGDDPHQIRKPQPISVAPLKIDGAKHYVYVVLGDSGITRAFSSTLGRTLGPGTVLLSILVVATIVVVGSGFMYLRLRKINTSLAAISHDLRGPLASVQGYLETLLERGDRLDKQESTRFMKVALKGTQSISSLVNDLHHLSKLEASGEKLPMEPFSILDLLMDVVMSAQPSYDEKGLSLEANAPPCVPLTFGNVQLVERLVRNLIENALRYTPTPGRVTVTLEIIPNRVRITVADTGCGIPQRELEKVGQEFYRGEKTRSSSPGSGLGLSIASRIARAHGSSLKLLSREGEGTAAIFDLPQAGKSARSVGAA